MSSSLDSVLHDIFQRDLPPARSADDVLEDAGIEFSSAQATARAAIQARDGGRHAWPSEEKVRVYHGIYIVPSTEGAFEPLWGIPPRFYFAFDLGWGVSPVVWFEAPAGTANADVDAGFPTRRNRRMTVAAAASIDHADQSWHAGRLLVAFRRPIDDVSLALRLCDVLPGSRSVGRLATNACYVSCAAFDEPAAIGALFRAPDVQYAEKVMHASPLTAGGRWSLRALTD